MKIFIRCDGGTKLGTGHIIRQLMIAKELKKKIRQAEIEFLMKNIPEGIKKVQEEGFSVRIISETADLVSEAELIVEYLKNKNPSLLILDILDTSKKYIEILKKLKAKIVSFDDHSDGKYLADLKFNILELDIEPGASNLFEGPEYVTLHPIYAEYHTKEKEIRKQANKILITFGGSDPGNITNKVLKALEKINEKLEINVVVGFAFSYNGELEESIRNSKHRIKLYKNISSQKMAELMFKCDIGIGAGGLTQYEFACVGLPALIICEDVEHQYKLANWFQAKGAFINLGVGKTISEEKISKNICELLEDYSKRKEMSSKGKSLCDGKGLERTINKILEIIQ